MSFEELSVTFRAKLAYMCLKGINLVFETSD